MIAVAGGRGLLGRLVAKITQLLTVHGNFSAALNGDNSQHDWQPLQRASNTLLRPTAPDGKNVETR